MTNRLFPFRKVSNSAGTMVVIPPEMVDAVSNGRRITSGGGPDLGGWMGPGQPPALVAPEGTEPRQFDYQVGRNQRYQPKAGEGVSFAHLRLLAEAWDLLRVVIERRKDQICCFDWELRAVKGKEAQVSPTDLETLTTFLRHPTPEYSWDEWLRMLLEDLLVLDAAVIVPRYTYGDSIYSLDPVDGASIQRVVDITGRMPLPPDTAFQQVIKGVPATDFTSEELVYWCRNPRTWRVYGFSPVEWIIVTVNIALRRQSYTMSYFEDGNIPEALAAAPENWTTAQIKEFQQHWDDLMSDVSKRRRIRWVPTDASKIKELKQPDHKNEFEEWLARLVCFAFSITPSQLIRDMNRATADTNKEIATEDGTMPLLRFVKTQMDKIIQRRLGFPLIEFAWSFGDTLNAVQQATVHGTYIDKKVLTPDEVREDLGRKPMTPAEREAAFPAPVLPPMMGAAPDEGEDGGKGKPPPGKKGDEEKPEEEVDDEGEPSKRARAFAREVAKHMPAPTVTVDVGDVNVTADLSKARQ